MNSSGQTKEKASDKRKEARERKETPRASKQSISTIAPPFLDHPLLNHMKTEIRRLYGEKVNMVNTNYLIKPQEFKLLAKTLSKAIWNEEKTLETIDDIIYAVDLLCNKKQSISDSKEIGSFVSSKEALTTVRFITSSIKSLIPLTEEKTSLCSGFLLSLDLDHLLDSVNVFQSTLAATGHSTLESLASENAKVKKIISSISQNFSISPADDLVSALKNLRKSEERSYADALRLKDKNSECERRHFEESIHAATEKISYLENENRSLKQRLVEREDRTAEVLERGDALEQNISQIKQVLAEEETRILQERQEYKKVKKTLINYNKKMAEIVQELVERIKKEQRERDSLIVLNDEFKDI